MSQVKHTHKRNLRQRKRVYLIVSEGDTEMRYFAGLRTVFNAHFRAQASLKIVRGVGGSFRNILQETLTLAQNGEFERVWCVLDVDTYLTLPART